VRRAVALLLLGGALGTGATQAATYAKGVDVSHWQGAIQWPQVAGAAYTFAFGKATEGKTLVDPTYPLNRSGAETVGLRFGAYHFARPAGAGDAALVADAVTQADFFLDVAQPQPGELPPVLDLEAKGGLTAAALQTWTRAWLDHVTSRTGVKALVYGSPNFWKTALGDTTSVAAAGHPLWVAHWTTNAAPLVPAGNWSGQSWTFWQFTNRATVPGFAHPVDGDRFRSSDPAAAVIAPYPTGAPAPSSPPTIVGTAQAGRSLAALAGTWGGGKPLTFSYQWQRCDAAGAGCAAIAGAGAQTYVPVTDDVGHALRVAVTAQAPSGATAASSPATVAVVASGSTVTRPAATSPPAIVGTAQAGQTLTSSVGAWSGAPTSFAYQWRRCRPQCVAIVGANVTSYTLTPDDIGASISLVVTATGRGGSTSAEAAASSPVTAAPVPPAVPGSAVAQAGAAGAVSSPDGAATVTWQPGAVPAGSTVSLAPAGRGFRFAVAPAVAQLQWPVDLTFGSPSAGVVGYSLDGKTWHVVPTLTSASLPVGRLAGTYADAGGGVHVLLRAPLTVAVFPPGAWGDPSLVAAGPPLPRRVAALAVKRLRSGVVQVTTRIAVRSQARVLVNVPGKVPAHRSQLLKPGSFPIRLRLRLAPRAVAQLRVVAVDPYGRRGTLLMRFRAP
jgi:GH25 family lysozyme M1 (1,4-beta-N-acetylmuramidase)